MSRLEGWRTNLSGPVPRARRIVAIAPSNTEILHALGLGRRIVAVDDWSDYPPRVAGLPRVGSDLRVDVERVRAARPDLVVASLHVPGMEHNLPRFDEVGLPYLALGGRGLDGVWDDVRVVGRFLGRAERAERLIADTRARMARIGAVCADARWRPRIHWEWSGRPHVAARRSWVTEMMELAGGANVYADLDVESTLVSVADAVARRPDVIVACWCGARKLPTVARILARPGWESTPAVEQGRVVVFAEDLFGRPGPRLASSAWRASCTPSSSATLEDELPVVRARRDLLAVAQLQHLEAGVEAEQRRRVAVEVRVRVVAFRVVVDDERVRADLAPLAVVPVPLRQHRAAVDAAGHQQPPDLPDRLLDHGLVAVVHDVPGDDEVEAAVVERELVEHARPVVDRQPGLGRPSPRVVERGLAAVDAHAAEAFAGQVQGVATDAAAEVQDAAEAAPLQERDARADERLGLLPAGALVGAGPAPIPGLVGGGQWLGHVGTIIGPAAAAASTSAGGAS
jgi:iron complex transport system substrate-binding protein